MKSSRSIARLIIGMICGIVLANHPLVSRILHLPLPAAETTQDESVTDINQIYNVLKNEYYDKEKVSLTGMREGGIKGFVQALKDPYTEYFTIDQNKGFAEQLEGQEEFEGIGAAVQKKDDAVQIQEVYKGTPAAVAGLRPLDAIVEIDGEKTKDLTIGDAVKKIRGPKGTQVKLLIFRGNEKDPLKRVFTVEVTRENVKIPSVQVDVIGLPGTDKQIAYIELALIGEQTEALLKQQLAAIQNAKVDGVVLDLRGNGGGYLPKSVEIASHFIPKGKIIVTGKYSILPTEQFVSKGYGDFEGKPIVVLVDALTASAGEIIAGALKQNVGATLVGTQTFGKGSIQTVIDVGSGAGLKYTVGKRYLPDDTNIDHEGLKPDILVEFDREVYEKNARDVQKERALEEVKKIIGNRE